MNRGPVRVALLCLVLHAAACSEPAAPAAPPATVESPTLSPVVATAIAELERELDPAGSALLGGDVETPPELLPRLEGLLATLAAASEPRGVSRRVALEELGQLGATAVPALAEILANRELPRDRRGAAAEALAALDLRASAEELLAVVEAARGNFDPEPWLVAQCAWRLGETQQDWVVPRLVLCMRYERDYESVLWIARTLGGFGNYSALEALRVVAESPGAELASRAQGIRSELAASAGFENIFGLEQAWYSGESLPEVPGSRARELEVWRTIHALSEWQLRGVDDGRFVLSRLGPAAAVLLARALEDEDLYMRVHSAQCLERMGPRAASAGPALVRALDDPALATQAAAALGGVGHAPACAPLIDRLDGSHPFELRVAAARALGALDCTEADTPLTALLASDEAIDLRAAAAGCLVRCGALSAAGPAVRLLAELMISGAVEPTVVEADLEAWLARGGPERVAEQVRSDWNAVAELEQAERVQQRSAIVLRTLD